MKKMKIMMKKDEFSFFFPFWYGNPRICLVFLFSYVTVDADLGRQTGNRYEG